MVLTPVRKQHIQGFALIEAMLALFVLTIGVLGVAGLQIRAMQSGSVAMQRTFVSMKTQELIERMLANPGLVTITRDM
ncbi:MAG TPA: type IV pilus modification protein PilV, partial [Gammaproteobacteria bacterium]|nr:type IV pilus modification protein PilV [Gammaproteobacteria bacterium]